MADELEFNCPRCTEPVRERFYGPCTACREAINAAAAAWDYEMKKKEWKEQDELSGS